MTSSSTSSNSDKTTEEPEGRLLAVVRSVATLARRLMIGVAVLSGVSAGAGALLWGLLWWPPSDNLVGLVGAVLTLVVLLSPAAILGLFYQGLRELRALPDRVKERTDRTLSESADAIQAVREKEAVEGGGRVWGLLRRVWALRNVLLENRALLLRYGALFRFVTPGFVLLVVGATAVTVLLVPVAVGAGMVVFLL